jgi:hypothetical protein
MKVVMVALVIGTLLSVTIGNAAASSGSASEEPKPPQPVIERLGVSTATIGHVSDATVILGGIIYDHGLRAHWRFEWGRNRSCGRIAKRLEGEREGDRQYVNAEFPVKSKTNYYFRLVAFNSAGRTATRVLHWRAG